MKRALGAAVTAVLIGGIASPAWATDQNIPLQAIVTSFCKIAGSLTPADDTLQTITVTDGFVVPGTITRPFAVVCNKATNISLAAKNGGLSTPTPSDVGFDNIINYTASTSGFADVNLTGGDTSTTSTAITNSYEPLGTGVRSTPGSTSISVVIVPTVNTNPLVPGTYNDTVRLSITPQP